MHTYIIQKKIMKILMVLLIVASLVIINSCEKSITSQPEITGTSYSITGKIIVDNSPVDSVVVQVDEASNWKTMTNNEGEFQINGITKGNHNFQAYKELENGKTISQTSEVTIENEDLILGDIKLPKPSILFPLDSTSISSEGIKLVWQRSSDPEYREYKIFRKTDAGLDETTGELIFITTNEVDTQYVDNSISFGLHYYYRVFILSSFGKLAGSNMVDILTPNPNYIINSDFEESSNGIFPDNWEYHPSDNEQEYLSISTEEKYSGNQSLHLSLIDSSIDLHEAWMVQPIDASALPKNVTYKYSFWAKSLIGKPLVYINWGAGTRFIEVPSGGSWQEYSATFNLPEDATLIKVFIAAFGEYKEDFRIEGWVDKMSLSIVQ